MVTLYEDLRALCPEGLKLIWQGNGLRDLWFPKFRELTSELGGRPLWAYTTLCGWSDVGRQWSLWGAQLGFFLDDIGTKVDGDGLPTPTWKIETSPSNFQYVYLFREALLDPLAARNLFRAAATKGITDRGCQDPGHLMRVPGTYNQKVECTKRDRKTGYKWSYPGDEPARPWIIKGDRVGDLWEVVTLVEALGLDGVFDGALLPGAGRGKGVSVGTDGSADLLPARDAFWQDDLAVWLYEEMGLLNPENMRGTGFFPMTMCPFAEGHSSGDVGGAAYAPQFSAERGDGAFHCFHEGCRGKHTDDLVAWAIENGYTGVRLGADSQKPPEGGVVSEDDMVPLEGRFAHLGLAEAESVCERYVHLHKLTKFWDRHNHGIVTGDTVNRCYGDKVQFYWNPGDEKLTKAKASYLVGRHGDQAWDAVWKPGAGTFFDWDGRRYVNSYQSPEVEIREDEPSLWTNHIRNVFGDAANHIMRFLAFTVQRPEINIDHALVFCGGQGVGKNIVLYPFAFLPGFMSSTTIDRVKDGYDDWRFERKLVVINEAKRSRKFDADDVHNQLKDIIAAPEPTYICNPKGRPQSMSFNLCSVVITTNYEDGLHIDDDERRYCICNAETTAEELRSADPGYFKKLGDWYDTGGIDHVLGWLMQLEVHDFDPKAPPPDWGGLDGVRRAAMSPDGDVLDGALDHEKLQAVAFIIAIHDEFKGWSPQRVAQALYSSGWRKFENFNAKGGRWMVDKRRVHLYKPKGMTDQLALLKAHKATTEDVEFMDSVANVKDLH